MMKETLSCSKCKNTRKGAKRKFLCDNCPFYSDTCEIVEDNYSIRLREGFRLLSGID